MSISVTVFNNLFDEVARQFLKGVLLHQPLQVHKLIGAHGWRSADSHGGKNARSLGRVSILQPPAKNFDFVAHNIFLHRNLFCFQIDFHIQVGCRFHDMKTGLRKAGGKISAKGFRCRQIASRIDPDSRECAVDFVVVRDRKPWFLLEVKLSDPNLSSSLAYFQGQTKAAHAFQVVFKLPYEPADCFRIHRPVVVPARTFLSQLL